MDRRISTHPDPFSFYYESMATIPAVPAAAKAPKLLHSLFYRSSKSALRRQVTVLPLGPDGAWGPSPRSARIEPGTGRVTGEEGSALRGA